MLSLLFTPAFASEAPAASFNWQSLGMIGLLFFVMYFFMIRPQQKKEAKRREMISKLSRGDWVVTHSGLIGQIHRLVSEDEITLDIAEGTRVRLLKNAVSHLYVKSKPEKDGHAVDEKKTAETDSNKPHLSVVKEEAQDESAATKKKTTTKSSAKSGTKVKKALSPKTSASKSTT